ncbi:uncharacterized protein LOC115875679 [Sitophilus oryzae]|uniref:Uncharacterized protein LOC115875679 n=1 Tax=Sitophilus oryzae TaxID=7048 RepID=A0A6J2X7V1_SITOR|nr:uncharacterized protein LOC115875679 [Sitophilus oryzae]
MSTAKTVAIPAEPGSHLSKPPDCNQLEIQSTVPYREAVGSLLFVAQGVSRPDIEYSVNRASQFLTNYREEHRQAVKRIIRYLEGTINFGIVYGHSGSDELIGYTDADYTGCIQTRRSTSGFTFLFAGGPVRSRVQFPFPQQNLSTSP